MSNETKEHNCGHNLVDWDGDGNCITCARDKIADPLGDMFETMGVKVVDITPRDQSVTETPNTLPTGTNQASELYELCKKVYERTGLGHPITDFERGIVIHWEDGQMFDFPTDELDIEEYIAPLYTSDYLLVKLLPITSIQLKRKANGDIRLFYFPEKPDYATYDYDTPLKCLLALTIALSEAGELNG